MMEMERISRERAATLVEAELRRKPRAFRGALYGLGGLLAAGLISAYFIRVPEIVGAAGLIRPAQEIVPIDAERTGRVTALAVREGDVVAKGQLLLELDDADARQPLEIQRERLTRLRAQQSELEKLLAMLRAETPHDLTLFAERFRSIRSELDLAQHRADAADREVKRFEQLEEAKSDVQIQQKRDAAREARLEHERLKNGHLSQVEAELHAAEREILTVRSTVEEYERDLARSRIRAPTAGKIIKAELREAGGVVQRGQRLFQIAPEGSGWVLESYLPGGKQGVVKPEMEARIHLAPYPATDYGTIDGRVEWISPDSAGPSEGVPARRVRVRLLADRVEGREGTGAVAMGMSAEARIVTRERRLLFHLIGKVESAFGLQD